MCEVRPSPAMTRQFESIAELPAEHAVDDEIDGTVDGHQNVADVGYEAAIDLHVAA